MSPKNWGFLAGTSYGATLLVSQDDREADFALLMLAASNVRAVTGVTLKGWSASTPSQGAEVATVGHPEGHYKRVAFGEVTNYTTWSDTENGAIQWRLGTTEPGSSGSPVLLSRTRSDGEGEFWAIVGIISGGNRNETDDGSPWGPYCDADRQASFTPLGRVYETIQPYMEDESELPKLPSFDPVEVELGRHGGTVTITQAEDGSWWVDGVELASGAVVVSTTNGNSYRLTLTDGEWEAEFVPTSVEVPLGNSGSTVTLTNRAEGRWSSGIIGVQDGSRARTANGDIYRLTLVDGEWVATKEP